MKNSKSDKTILNEDCKIVSDEKELCRTFSTFFENIISNLKIPNIHENEYDITSNHDPVLAAINTFKNHPSVANIKQRGFNTIFSFNNTDENVYKITKNLNVC